MMASSPRLTGQWLGSFSYGPMYSKKYEDKRVLFRLFIDEEHDRGFTGKCFDLEGYGAGESLAAINGFARGTFISFTKDYPFHYTTDKWGRVVEDRRRPHPTIHYYGEYDPRAQTFSGRWEMRTGGRRLGIWWVDKVFSGSWTMRKDDP